MATATTTASGAAVRTPGARLLAACAPPPSRAPRRVRGEVSIALLVSVALTAVVTVVLAVFAVYFYQSEKAQRWDELRRGLATSAEELAAAVSLPVWNFDEAQIVTVMKSGLSNRRLHASMVTPAGGAHPYILLRNEDGMLVGSPVAPQEAGLLVERRQMVVEGHRIGSITLYASPEDLLGELRQRAYGIVGMILLLDLVLVAGLYALLWHMMLKPVQAIGRYAVDVEAGLNPGAQAPRAWFFGELKRLYATIRDMVALLEQRYLAIQASEQRLQIATRAAGIGIWDWNIQTGVAEWDEQMYRLYGVTRADVASPFQLWLDQLHSEDAERAKAALQRALEGGDDMTDEFRVVWPDGSVHHIQVDAMLFRDAAGQPTRMVGVNYDITAHKLAQQELRRHRQHLEDLVADRTQALSVALAQAQAQAADSGTRAGGPACAAAAAGAPLTAAQLGRLPAGLRQPLHEAVRQLNLAQVVALLAPLPPELADVVAGIEAMLARHAYPQLCALLQEQGWDVKEQA